jgi:ABC-type antimicrobial peptide transport system permease subunit
VAVFLTLLGDYGLLSYAVAQRNTEIGLRMALGASRTAVVGMVIRYGLQLTAGGLAIGLSLSAALGRFVAGFLYGVQALDPVTFVAVPALMVGVTAAACAVPAWKAARIDPADALRRGSGT